MSEWRTYEDVARYLLNKFATEFDVDRFEVKQSIRGNRSGTNWEIEAKGFKDSDATFIIVECRRYTKEKQNQEKIGALAYRILDTGASGGIIVSPLGLQEGAKKIADAEKIEIVKLNPDANRLEYFMEFLNTIAVGFCDRMPPISDSLTIAIYDANTGELKTRENLKNII